MLDLEGVADTCAAFNCVRTLFGMLSHQKTHLQVFPLFAALGLGVGACVYSVSRNFLTNPDVR